MTDQEQAKHMASGFLNADPPTETFRPVDQESGKKGGETAPPGSHDKTKATLDDSNMDELGFSPGG